MMTRWAMVAAFLLAACGRGAVHGAGCPRETGASAAEVAGIVEVLRKEVFANELNRETHVLMTAADPTESPLVLSLNVLESDSQEACMLADALLRAGLSRTVCSTWVECGEVITYEGVSGIIRATRTVDWGVPTVGWPEIQDGRALVWVSGPNTRARWVLLRQDSSGDWGVAKVVGWAPVH